jgi:uncharacterized membrane protein YcaP (DUF421 family)
MDFFSNLLGLNVEPPELTFLQISLRGIVVFTAALIMLRAADRRFLAKLSAFDAILGLILASMLARAVNGSAAFLPTLGAGFVIVGLHRGLGWLAYTFPPFGKLVKGEPQVLVREGKLIKENMRAQKISEEDLLEEMRLNGHLEDVEDVGTATMERNGEISVISKE